MIATAKLSLFSPEHLKATFSYASYMELMEQVVTEGRTTGSKQSPDYAHYTKLNLARMQRLNNTLQLEEAMVSAAKSIQSPQQWFVLTEAWCGDAAQCVPVIAKIAEANPLISLTLMLRDENPAVMEQYLTNGGKSIPKLIAFQGQESLFTWGPRPAGAQALYTEHGKNPGTPLAEFLETLQKWYNADKTRSVQEELLSLIKKKG